MWRSLLKTDVSGGGGNGRYGVGIFEHEFRVMISWQLLFWEEIDLWIDEAFYNVLHL